MAANRLIFCTGLIVVFSGCVLEPYATTPTTVRLQQAELQRPVRAASFSVLDQTSKQFPQTNDPVATRIRALVNTTPILEEEVREAASRHLVELQSVAEPERSVRHKEIVNRELQQLIERELIIQDMMGKVSGKGREKILDKVKEAASKEFTKKVDAMRKTVREKLKLTSEDDFRALLKAQGMSLEGMRRQNERDFLATAYVRNLIDTALERVGHEEVREYYQAHQQDFQTVDRVQWQTLFVDAGRFRDRNEARRFAEQILAQARSGADFQKLAMQHDMGDSRYRNGDGYGTRRGEIQPPDVEKQLFQMKAGELGVLEAANGLHVFKLLKRDYAGVLPLDDKLQTTIRNKIKNEVWEREYKRIVARLRQQATIEILEDRP